MHRTFIRVNVQLYHTQEYGIWYENAFVFMSKRMLL